MAAASSRGAAWAASLLRAPTSCVRNAASAGAAIAGACGSHLRVHRRRRLAHQLRERGGVEVIAVTRCRLEPFEDRAQLVVLRLGRGRGAHLDGRDDIGRRGERHSPSTTGPQRGRRRACAAEARATSDTKNAATTVPRSPGSRNAKQAWSAALRVQRLVHFLMRPLCGELIDAAISQQQQVLAAEPVHDLAELVVAEVVEERARCGGRVVGSRVGLRGRRVAAPVVSSGRVSAYC